MSAVQRMSLILFFFTLVWIGCAPKSSDVIVLEVGKAKVNLSEYENFFVRNSGGWESATKSSPAERERFLDLLTNYKLKLQDAYDRNLVADPEIQQELRGYRSTLASTFILDKDVTEPGLRSMYEHRKEEIRAQHILVKLAPNATPEDTLKAYAKATDLIRRIKAGENFDSLARHNSEDPSVKVNGGDIYYFTGGQMVTAFENAAYAMNQGEVSSLPVRTPFGYHIIRIKERHPVLGTIKVSHIMARFQTPSPDSADTASALVRIRGIQDSLRKGWEFHKLATKLSEDAGSAPQGGDLGWFERRRFVQPFDEAAFKLSPGVTSPVVRTPYGYHILLMDSLKPMADYQSMRDQLKKIYLQNRYNEDYNAYIAGLKAKFHYTLDDGTLTSFISSLDTTKLTGDSAWTEGVATPVRSHALMTISGRPVSLDTVITILETKPEFRNTPTRPSELRQHITSIGDALLLEEQSVGLEQRSPEFASLMKEYTDGVVLFKAEQNEVWNKTSVSDSALKEYFSQNRDSFKFPDRVNISVISVDQDTLAYQLYDSLKHGGVFEKFASLYTENPGTKSKNGERGLQDVDTDSLTKHAATMAVGDISEPIQLGPDEFDMIKLIAREPSRQKTYEEAGAEVSNSYQEHLSKLMEEQWLARIRQTHPVVQYKQELSKAFSSPRPSQ